MSYSCIMSANKRVTLCDFNIRVSTGLSEFFSCWISTVEYVLVSVHNFILFFLGWTPFFLFFSGGVILRHTRNLFSYADGPEPEPTFGRVSTLHLSPLDFFVQIYLVEIRYKH